jgi:RNA polymerase sigma factor (TIGR02999 family)
LLVGEGPFRLGGLSDVTRILDAIQQGDPAAAEELLPLVYNELRKLAAHKMANEQPGHTLQPTALVHEAYLRLVGSADVRWNGRGHFFAAAAEAMRRILVERARRKHRLKHGGGQQRLDIEQLDVAAVSDDGQLLAVNDALDKLAERDKLGADLIKLRFFTGLSNVQAAELLGIPERSAKRTWAYARAWLYEELKKTL